MIRSDFHQFLLMLRLQIHPLRQIQLQGPAHFCKKRRIHFSLIELFCKIRIFVLIFGKHATDKVIVDLFILLIKDHKPPVELTGAAAFYHNTP